MRPPSALLMPFALSLSSIFHGVTAAFLVSGSTATTTLFASIIERQTTSSTAKSATVRTTALASVDERRSGADVGSTFADDDRRSFLVRCVPSLLFSAATPPVLSAAFASDETPPSGSFTRQAKDYGYSFTPPPGFSQTQKPLKTHMDEVNFTKEGVRGYQYGITVDPVRISNLRQFGTPEEVAARVVMAEVNRDGIFDVTLAKDPVEEASSGSYAVDYVSNGKRGTKHFVTRIFVKESKLYVLTAQVKEEDFATLEEEILSCVKTFSPM